MWKDGHMVDDTQQYIRDRKATWAIFNDCYAIFDLGEKFNSLKTGECLMLPIISLVIENEDE